MAQKIALPIDDHIETILGLIYSDSPVVLTASPGSGKTTRVPAQLLISHRKKNIQKKIIVIVPKRLAAVAACDRIASENNWVVGQEVGYQVRFESQHSADTKLLFMTEGVFLKKLQNVHFWNEIDTIILDEFHERSSNMDLILGLCFERKIFTSALQIVVMSATLNVEKLKKYFGPCEHIHIEQKPFQLELIYQNSAQLLVCDQKFFDNIKKTTLDAFKKSKKDILIFLPGLKEIIKTQTTLRPVFPSLQIEIVYGGMSLSEQKKILNKISADRRIILATNIAESSLTIPDVDCVIDSGLEKVVVREKKMNFTKLELRRISKFSATQRAGRAARTSEGFAFKLWHMIDERSMPDQKKPEIMNSLLEDEVLLLSSLGVTDCLQFSWLEPPATSNILSAFSRLKNWNLICADHRVTSKGAHVSQIPLELPSALLFYELCSRGFKNEACQILVQLETADLSKRPTHNTLDSATDLDYILGLGLTESQSKIHAQLLKFSNDIDRQNFEKPHSDLSLEMSILDLFARNFSERICLKKMTSVGVSSSGRGVELTDSTSLLSKKIANDYFVAFSGFEKNASSTLIQLGLGFSKAQAAEVLSQYLSCEIKVEFVSDRQIFRKKSIQKFGEFIFKESSPEVLSSDELANNWRNFVTNDALQFLALNPSFDTLMIKLNFLRTKHEILNLTLTDFDFLDQFEQQLAIILTESVLTFQDFLSIDYVFYINEVIPQTVQYLLTQLPNQVQLPNGRSVLINYTDPKAPLISARIQDCFMWQQTPKLLNDALPYTIELLAPNMRPAQITNDLANFWSNSYKDVRKDLKARYPRHHWPENPVENPTK